MEAFSAEWADTWCRALNTDPAFRTAAVGWEGDVVVIMTQSGAAEAPHRAVRMDLARGECRGAQPASEVEIASASYVLTASGAVWKEVLSGHLNPLMALMSGKLRLTRGSLAALVPYGGMARELIRLAIDMKASFPAGW